MHILSYPALQFYASTPPSTQSILENKQTKKQTNKKPLYLKKHLQKARVSYEVTVNPLLENCPLVQSVKDYIFNYC